MCVKGVNATTYGGCGIAGRGYEYSRPRWIGAEALATGRIVPAAIRLGKRSPQPSVLKSGHISIHRVFGLLVEAILRGWDLRIRII